jgi:hypothetical protein
MPVLNLTESRGDSLPPISDDAVASRFEEADDFGRIPLARISVGCAITERVT